ncbi:MAG: ABC transporter ATP-binding protein [Deltaproteobacteria bacterium]|nr:ABC transporter ATP-binding protein [Deltaproteobacteria bacterium]
MSEVVIRTEKVTRILSGEVPVTLVRDVDVEIKRSEFVVISGPSGSGKSSLLYLLGLLDTPTSGKIWLMGQDTSSFDEDQLADVRLSKIGFVFQFHFLLPEFSALENVMLPMRRLNKLPESEVEDRARSLLVDLGLEKQLNNLPKQLSGGQSQRVAIARALANDPSIILADEPTGNLDTASSKNVEGILRELSEKHGRAVMVVTHEARLAENADRTIRIVDGRVQA